MISLMHATALTALRQRKDVPRLDTAMEVIEGLNKEQVEESLNSLYVRDKVFLILTWLQDVVIIRENDGGIAVPPPICSRIFEELSQGALGYGNALKVHNTPFPFPYAQFISASLVVMMMTIGMVMNVVITSAFWSALFRTGEHKYWPPTCII